MFAIVMNRFGGPAVMQMGEVATPRPGADEVLIEVMVAGVNPVDAKERAGVLARFYEYQFPFIPGFDAAGVVCQVGANVRHLREGDRVMTGSNHGPGCWGSYAQYVRVTADQVAPMPRTLDFVQASTIPIAAMTAHQALFAPAKGALKTGQTALLHGAAGGIGGFAVQFCKAAGVRVAATCRTGNVPYVQGLGADCAIDYCTQEVANSLREWAPGGVDVVIDAVGGGTLGNALDLLRPGGRVVSIATLVQDGDIEADMREAQSRGFHKQFAIMDFTDLGMQLAQITELIESGLVHTPPTEVLALSDAAQAHERLEARQVRGKLALQVAAASRL